MGSDTIFDDMLMLSFHSMNHDGPPSPLRHPWPATTNIIQRGNNRQAIFTADADYQFFRDALDEAAKKQSLAIHAYVWMTDHIHLLAMPEFDHGISNVVQSVGRRNGSTSISP